MTSFVTFSSGRRPAAQQQVAAHQRQEWQSQELWRQPLKGASHFPGRRSSSQTSPPPTLKWYFKEIFSRQENPSKTRFYLFVWLLLSKLLLVFVVVRRPRRRRRRCRFFDHCARMEKKRAALYFCLCWRVRGHCGPGSGVTVPIDGLLSFGRFYFSVLDLQRCCFRSSSIEIFKLRGKNPNQMIFLKKTNKKCFNVSVVHFISWPLFNCWL